MIREFSAEVAGNQAGPEHARCTLRPVPQPSCNALPRVLERFVERRPGIAARYLALDPRALGLARIYLGCLLLTDLLRRAPLIPTFYANEGLLPNHLLLWSPGAELQFSFFFLASHVHEAVVLFVLHGLVFLLLALGYRTRVVHPLALLCICSLHGRHILFDDGSETSTRLLAFWTMFLPMGARYSLDALDRHRREPAASPEARPAISLAVLGVLLQLAVVYLFNVLHKNGRTWHEGSAVHYVLHQDRIVTWLGWQLRQHMSLASSKALSFGALAMEASLPLLLLSPFSTRVTRRIAIAVAIALHLGFAVLLNLGLFSFNMIGFFLLLLGDAELRWLARAGAVLATPFRPLIEWLRGVALLGLAYVRGDVVSSGSSPLRRDLARLAPGLREGLVAVFFVVLGAQTSSQNPGVPDALRVEPPYAFRLLVEYPRLFQGWSMFAPDAPTSDLHLVVDAVTADGRHVDPFNQLASRVADPLARAIPERLGQDDAFCDYILGIVNKPQYQPILRDWIFAYADRTGQKRDAIQRFDVWVLEDDSPKPGSTRPTNLRSRVLLHDQLAQR